MEVIMEKGLMDQEKIKILIIDDSMAWVKRLSILLNMEDDMIVIGVAHEKNEGYDLINVLKPDVVLLDLYFTDNQPEGLSYINEIKDKTKVIVTTISENPEHVKEAILSGAKEFVVKESIGKLPVTIRESYKRWTTAELMADVIKNNEKLVVEKKKDDLLNKFELTAKEKEVFKFLESNLNRTQISNAMFITKDTVKNHITNILEKLSVKNTQRAIEKIKVIMNK
jgi:NarL family two-component system response regulator LiaR